MRLDVCHFTRHCTGTMTGLRTANRCDDVILCAFHLLELEGHHMRRAPLEERKPAQAKLLRRPSDDIGLNEHYTGDGAIIFKHSCA